MTADLTVSGLVEKLTLKQAMRIHFAGQAMQGLVFSLFNSADCASLAKMSVDMADALIAELEKAESK